MLMTYEIYMEISNIAGPQFPSTIGSLVLSTVVGAQNAEKTVEKYSERSNWWVKMLELGIRKYYSDSGKEVLIVYKKRVVKV